MLRYLIVFLSVVLFTFRLVSASLETIDSQSDDVPQSEKSEVSRNTVYLFNLFVNDI